MEALWQDVEQKTPDELLAHVPKRLGEELCGALHIVFGRTARREARNAFVLSATIDGCPARARFNLEPGNAHLREAHTLHAHGRGLGAQWACDAPRVIAHRCDRHDGRATYQPLIGG